MFGPPSCLTENNKRPDEDPLHFAPHGQNTDCLLHLTTSDDSNETPVFFGFNDIEAFISLEISCSDFVEPSRCVEANVSFFS